MAELKIVTNNHVKLLLDWNQLTVKEQVDFDYLDEDNRIGRDFIRYRGVTYDLVEFMYITEPRFKGWHGYNSDTFFSGILVRYIDPDHVIMGTYYS